MVVAIAILGPTAAGKTALALEYATRASVEIINLDAMQIFRGLDIGTAKPTPDERQQAPHHLFDIREPDQPLGAGAYAELAESLCKEILARGATPLFVGGTVFYFQVLKQGLAPIPDIPATIRQELRAGLEEEGLPSLRLELERVDPEWAAQIHPNDTQRTTRGLEVYRHTGRALSTFLKEPRQGALSTEIHDFMVDPGPELLDERINIRAEEMLAAGLEQEVRAVLDRGYGTGVHGLTAPGYREVLAYIEGIIEPAELAPAIAQSHRRFAKRQRTFLRSVGELSPITTSSELEEQLHDKG